jgi:hypothetical protein
MNMPDFLRRLQRTCFQHPYSSILLRHPHVLQKTCRPIGKMQRQADKLPALGRPVHGLGRVSAKPISIAASANAVVTILWKVLLGSMNSRFMAQTPLSARPSENIHAITRPKTQPTAFG